MGKREREKILKSIETLNMALNIVEKGKGKYKETELAILKNDCEECLRSIEITKEKIYGNAKQEELKKEIVFLPYKASMWDSLESVWKAACADKDCIVKVIPIPYFERDEHGCLNGMYWEGNEFPDYVPITRYDEYDLEEHHPDMVFIHNPYDEYNTITSVHPDYYSSKIKNYTDRLIYIPYFVLEETDINDYLRAERKKHYCLTAGVLNANYTIVQSEAMRQMYINVLSENYGEHTRKHWEKRILGLGSPKDEKVYNQSEETLYIPDEWKEVITKEDGKRKKVVLYNVSIGTFLKYRSIMLDKIEKTLAWFKENTDELALLWRPHPLYKATIASVAPELSERYDEIVNNYVKKGWGIYDDTSDLDRAIFLSDAYYGDHSSVERLYQKTGKPIVFQNPMVKLDTSILLTEDALRNGDKIYFMARDMNAVCVIDVPTQKMSIIGKMPEEIITAQLLAIKLLLWNEKIIFVPSYASALWIYDIDKADWEKIELDNTKCRYNKFYNAEIYKDKLIMLGGAYPCVVCVDLRTKAVRYVDVGLYDLAKKLEMETQEFFKRDSRTKEHFLYTSVFNEEQVLMFDMEKEKGKWLRKDDVQIYLGESEYNNNNLVMIKEGGVIEVYDGEKCIASIIPNMEPQEVEEYILSDETVLQRSYYESNIIGLPMYKKILCNATVSTIYETKKKNIGEAIYKTLKEL